MRNWMNSTSPFVMHADDGGTPPADPGGGTGTPPAPTGDPWYKGADAELIGHLQTKGWHDKPANEAALAAIAAHREAEKFLGVPADRIIKLPDATDPAGMRPVYERLGAPKEAKDYDFTALKFGDGTAPAPEFTDWLRTQAHALGMSKDAAATLGSEFVKYLEGSSVNESATRTAALAEEHKVLDASWGQNKDLNTLVARRGAEKLGFTAEDVAKLESNVGFAKTMEALRRVGELSGEARFTGNGNPTLNNGVMTREQAVSRKAELMNDTAWTKRYMDGGTEEAKQMLSLNTIIVGDDTEYSRGM